jgi:enamine deaminase RidA (YjgF/YER057c/UK114 family)
MSSSHSDSGRLGGSAPPPPTNAVPRSEPPPSPRSSTPLELFNPLRWSEPKGYSNGAVVRGATLYVAGQIGWDAEQHFASDDFVEQFAQALDNVIEVLRAAGAEPSDVAKMTIYVTDIEAYRAATRGVGAAWRARFGKHYPAMALVAVAALVEPRARVEIETVAVLRDGAARPSPSPNTA